MLMDINQEIALKFLLDNFYNDESIDYLIRSPRSARLFLNLQLVTYVHICYQNTTFYEDARMDGGLLANSVFSKFLKYNYYHNYKYIQQQFMYNNIDAVLNLIN